VKDPSRSAKGAFTLGNVVAAGPYDYGLFHGGVKVRYYKGCIDDTVVHFSALRRLVR